MYKIKLVVWDFIKYGCRVRILVILFIQIQTKLVKDALYIFSHKCILLVINSRLMYICSSQSPESPFFAGNPGYGLCQDLSPSSPKEVFLPSSPPPTELPPRVPSTPLSPLHHHATGSTNGASHYVNLSPQHGTPGPPAYVQHGAASRGSTSR